MDIRELRGRFNVVSGGDSAALKALECDLTRVQHAYPVGSWGADQCYYMRRALEVKVAEREEWEVMAQSALLAQQGQALNRALRHFVSNLQPAHTGLPRGRWDRGR